VKSIAIARMLLDGPYTVGCRYTLDDALLAAQLRQLGADARLYAGKSEGRVVDLARQFVRMRTQACLFAVEPVTLALMQQIVVQVRALAPSMEVFFHGPVDAAQRQALSAGAVSVHWLADEPEACLAELATLLGGDAVPAAIHATVSPYLAGLIHEDEAARLGLSADRQHDLVVALHSLRQCVAQLVAAQRQHEARRRARRADQREDGRQLGRTASPCPHRDAPLADRAAREPGQLLPQQVERAVGAEAQAGRFVFVDQAGKVR
jgi:hypothetical protein